MKIDSPTLRYENRPVRATVSLAGTRFHIARLLRPAFVAALLAISCAPLRADPLLTYPLRIGAHSIRAELANTPQTRRDGLMFKQRLAESSGMIFVFPRTQRVSMWMKNTLIPLSVAFIDADGRILNIEDMQPLSTRAHASQGKARYALEMNQGWFAARAIRAGERVLGLERLPAAK